MKKKNAISKFFSEIGLLLATVGCDLMQILSEYLFFGR